MIIVGINAACSLLYIATDIKIFDRIAKILGNRHYIWCVFIGIVTALLIEKGPKLLADYKNRANRPLLCALILALALWCAVYAKLGSIWFPVYTALFIAAIIIRPAMPAKIATFIGAVAGVTLAWYLVHQNMGYALIGTLVTWNKPRGRRNSRLRRHPRGGLGMHAPRQAAPQVASIKTKIAIVPRVSTRGHSSQLPNSPINFCSAISPGCFR